SQGLWRWRFHLACAGFCSFLAPLRSCCYGARRNFVTAAPFQARARTPGSAPTARRLVNEAGFEVGVMMSPEEADRLGLKPFGDGGAENETSPRRPKFYTHGPCRSPAASQFVVSCAGFEDADEAEQRRMAAEATQKMKSNGFVVLESLLPQEWVAKLEAEAAAFLDLPQPGLIPQPLRAGRTEGHLSFTAPWASDWLLRNELVLEVVAGYMNNNLAAGRTQDEQQWGLVQWLTSGASLGWFSMPEWGPKAGHLLEEPPPGCSDVGTHVETGPFFGRISLIRTPPGSEPQKHHRDINFPGPAAQVTAQVALTQLHANNGPLAYVPGSHRMLTPGFEVVAAPPLGSVVLYDSFCEHRGIEHHGNKDRYAVYYEFETRGVFSGYTAAHFGPESEAHMRAFRDFVDPALRGWVQRVGA
ncbi:PORA, partial [Symbiodinium microadriaticum]